MLRGSYKTRTGASCKKYSFPEKMKYNKNNINNKTIFFADKKVENMGKKYLKQNHL